MKISYSINNKPRVEEVTELFASSGINRPIHDLPRIQQMIEHANLIVTARDGDNLVGIARALTDFCYCCLLSDLAVHKKYQKQGVGRELISVVQREIGEKSMLLLQAAVPAMDYYPKIGFEKVENGWIIKRKE